MMVYRRAVRFEEVDAARIVFFGRFFSYAHEAMEHFFSPIEGGYAGCILGRDVGFPAVKVEASYHSPLRYGDVVDIETSVTRLGGKSCVLRYRFVKVPGGSVCAEVFHTVVITRLSEMRSTEMPPDVRAHLEAHRSG